MGWELMYATMILFDYLNIIVVLCTIYLCLIKIHTYILATCFKRVCKTNINTCNLYALGRNCRFLLYGISYHRVRKIFQSMSPYFYQNEWVFSSENTGSRVGIWLQLIIPGNDYDVLFWQYDRCIHNESKTGASYMWHK